MNQTITIKKEDLIIDLLTWQKRGLQYTATGYGDKIPTHYKYKHNNRMKRVYCRIYSNCGDLYIISGGQKVFLDV